MLNNNLFFTAREWSYLPVGPEGITDAQCDQLHLAAISAAKRLGLPENGVLARGFRRLETRQVCGIIAVPGISLEILPKLKDDNGRLRALLVQMLAIAFDVPLAEGQITGLDTQDKDLLDVFINLFVTRLSHQVQRGLPKAYLPEDDALNKLRGRLDLRKQMQQHAANPSRLHCKFDELSENTPLSRVFKTGLVHAKSFVRSEQISRQIAKLLERFAEVPQSQDPLKETIHWNRMNSRFQDAYTLVRMILESEWQNTTSGRLNGLALLFPMNRIFERYVARCLQKVMPTGSVSLQHRSHTLLQHGAYPLIPDIVIQTTDGPLIIDTKWKELKFKEGLDPSVSIADLYQLASYGTVYNANRVVILYPTTGQELTPRVWRYSATNKLVEIWSVDLLTSTQYNYWENISRQLMYPDSPRSISGGK